MSRNTVGQASCPVPDVDRELSRYIHSRQKTRQMRSSLSKFLAGSLALTQSQTSNQHLSIECPQGQVPPIRRHHELQDKRLDFLHALQAHAEARARHQKLQETLEGQREQQLMEVPSQTASNYDSDIIRGYVSLVRQRRRLSELQIIQESLEALLNAVPADMHQDTKPLVKKTVGEQPDLPAERLEIIEQQPDTGDWMFKLKQEVVDAQAKMNREKAARAAAPGDAARIASLEQQVYALGCARDEIVAWVEGELAKISEESTLLEDASPVKKVVSDPENAGPNSSEDQIKSAYEQYKLSRTALIRAQVSIGRTLEITRGEAGSEAEHDKPGKSHNGTEAVAITTKFLVHQPTLTRASENESLLLQRSVYLQTQLAAGSEETVEALTRLSHESHLLASGSAEPTTWGKIAKAADANTEEIITTQLIHGRDEIENVQAIVDLCSLHGKLLNS